MEFTEQMHKTELKPYTLLLSFTIKMWIRESVVDMKHGVTTFAITSIYFMPLLVWNKFTFKMVEN